MIILLLLYMLDVDIYAHRGASSIAPEHTFAAYDRSFGYLEIDLMITKDGEVIAMHDRTLDRTTNGSGKVIDHTLEEIKQLDAGSWFDESYKGAEVPTLAEIFERYGNSRKYFLETRYIDGRMEKEAQRLIEKYNIKHVAFQSWHEESLALIDDKYREIKLFNWPIDEIPLDEVETYADGIGYEARFINEATVQEIKSHDLELIVYFYNTSELRMPYILSHDIEGVFTDYALSLR